MMRLSTILAATFVLAACGDKPQTGSASKLDAPPYAGTQNAFNAPGWKAGDKVSWEQQLKARAQAGQNEYNRVK
jgi:hypothetical protein